MNTKVKCTICGEYRERKAMLVVATGNTACSKECLTALRERRRPKRAPMKVSAPSNPIPAKIREQVLERDGRRCRSCGTSHQLHPHHINYRSEQVDHQPHNIITLCRACHELVHSNKRKYQPLLRGVIWSHYVLGKFVTLQQFERWHTSDQTSDVG